MSIIGGYRQVGGTRHSITCTPSKLSMDAETENGHRPPIAVIGRVVYKLIVERQLGTFEHRHIVIGRQGWTSSAPPPGQRRSGVPSQSHRSLTSAMTVALAQRSRLA